MANGRFIGVSFNPSTKAFQALSCNNTQSLALTIANGKAKKGEVVQTFDLITPKVDEVFRLWVISLGGTQNDAISIFAQIKNLQMAAADMPGA